MSRWPRGTLYPQKLTLTSLTSGGRPVGIVRSRTQATDFFLSGLHSEHSSEAGAMLTLPSATGIYLFIKVSRLLSSCSFLAFFRSYLPFPLKYSAHIPSTVWFACDMKVPPNSQQIINKSKYFTQKTVITPSVRFHQIPFNTENFTFTVAPTSTDRKTVSLETGSIFSVPSTEKCQCEAKLHTPL
jgi:hypothetical protein